MKQHGDPVWGIGTWGGLVACAVFALLLASCSSSPTVIHPVVTSPSAFTQVQVLGWVTPTLSNGISLVSSLPPGATAPQLASSSRPLRAAVVVSLHELTQVPWSGPLQKDENSLVKALARIGAQTAVTPGPTYLVRLDVDILRAQEALAVLNRAVHH